MEDKELKQTSATHLLVLETRVTDFPNILLLLLVKFQLAYTSWLSKIS